MTLISSKNSSATSADVAIIMRTKDRHLLLPRALGSVLLQKFTNWHLYLVNDGGEREELDKLLEVYQPIFGKRLTVLHNEKSLGLAAALNVALAAGSEEFVAVHGDGDSWDPAFLINTVLFLSDPKKATYLGVATDCYVIDEVIEEGGVIRETRRHVWAREKGVTDYTKMLCSNTFAPICFLFRRSVISQIGLFDASLPALGDWDFNIRLMMKGDIGHICKPLANYHYLHETDWFVDDNTAAKREAAYRLQSTLLQNRLLRSFLDKQPEALGFLMTLLKPIRETHERIGHTQHALGELQHHVHYLDRRIDELLSINRRLASQMSVVVSELEQVRTVASWQKKMLRPVHKVWRSALPVRRVIARLRGRP